jgi:hypothetical protein
MKVQKLLIPLLSSREPSEGDATNEQEDASTHTGRVLQTEKWKTPALSLDASDRKKNGSSQRTLKKSRTVKVGTGP